MITKSGVRDAAEDVNLGADFYEEFDQRARELIDRTVERAQANDRKTVTARDV